MAKLKDIIAYFCKKYPYKDELSKERLTKMVYLADWKSAISICKQISDIKWIYGNYGPYTNDISNIICSCTTFDIDEKTVKLKFSKYKPNLTKKDREIINSIISITHCLYWNEFIELVYSTYPIMKSKKHSELNLVELAKKYNKTVF